jgi:Zn-dependent oligopeptidase
MRKSVKALFDVCKPRDYIVSNTTGLFRLDNLRNPQDFANLANETLAIAQQSVNIIEASDDKWTVKRLDRLSDILCRIVDVAEFVRNSHPDGSFVAAADNVYQTLGAYLGVLNTHPGLYKVWQFVFRKLFNDTGATRQFEKASLRRPRDKSWPVIAI